MPLTAPGSISNSGSKPFSNLFGRIAMDNYNIIKASQSTYDYYASLKHNHKRKHKKCLNFKPKSVNEVLLSTKLV